MIDRQTRAVLAGVILAVATVHVSADTPYEPAGFIPPPNLLETMQAAQAAQKKAPALPPAQPPSPTTGTAKKAFESPWTEELEFGNSPLASSATGAAQTTAALQGQTVQTASVATDGMQSALAGGTTMMLSTLPTVAGRVPSTFDVSSVGAATYAIPLWTPPGALGIEPKLALVYSNNTPDSLMGPGWSLSGLSMITRCSKTLAQDGAPASVTLTTSDKFCLDGNKLRLTGGTYGTAGSTYQTEIETFSKVTANGTSGGGPQWFEVKGKNGLIYEYGNTVDSQVAGVGNSTPYIWALNKVRDRQGNNMTISYTLSNGTFRPNTISYTQTPATSSAYNYTVVFGYTTRAAAVNLNSYVANASVQQTMVLTSIDVRHLGSTVRMYNIDYATGAATQRPRVSAVQTCSTTDCLKPTTVNYQDGTAGVAGPSTSASTGATTGRMNTVDIDGDGRQDLVYAVTSGSNQLWYVKFATTSGFGPAVSTGVTLASTDAILFDDFLAEGRTTALVPQSGTWYLLRWNGSAFTTTSTGLAVVSDPMAANLRFASADVDGDGRPDLVSYHNSAIYTRLNTSSGTSPSFASTETLAYGGPGVIGIAGNNSFSGTTLRHMDFNGDGRDDVVATILNFSGGPTVSYYFLLSSGTTFTYGGATGYTPSGFIPLQFNNDACTDVAIPGSIFIMGCNGAPGSSVTYSGTPILAADWDGDGRSDIWVNSGGTFQVYRSYGNALSTAQATGISVGSGTYQVFDQNGDGLDDLAFADSGASYAVSYGLHNGAGVQPDLALSMVDGYGMSVTFNYRPISDTTDTVDNPLCNYRDTPPPAAARVFTGPMYVACKMTATDGTGSTYTVTNTFYNPAYDLQGRGFLGFQRRYSIDSRDGILKMDNYGQTFPYIGMFAYQLVRQPGGSIYMSQLTNTLSSLSFGTGYDTRSFPYVSQSVEDVYEVGGALNSQWITHTASTMTPDSYGNPANVTVAVTDKTSQLTSGGETFSTQTVNTITNDATNWCLGRPTQTQVTSTLPDMTSQTRTTSATVDYTNCRVTQEVVEPSSTTLKVTTNFGFDGCGNVNSIGVVGKDAAGADMPTRTTTSNYGTRCQLPESVTNALTQTSTIAYNYNFGLPSSTTDANGITTSWLYDGYGRKTQENRPDGTHSQWGYYFCDSSNGYCGVADLRWYVEKWEFTSSWSQIRYDYDFFDGLDRTRYKEAQNLTGGLDLSIATYDAFGRKASQYNPFSGTAIGFDWFAYDLVGRLVADNLYDMSLSLYRQTAYGYEGRKTNVTDALGNTTAKYTDVRGNLRLITDPPPGSTSSYAWDHFGNPTQTTDAAGAVSSFTYNIRGFKTASSDADAGPWTYELDSLGEITRIRDAKTSSPNWTTVLGYDLLGRLTSRQDVPESVTSTWTWGASSGAKNIGKLASLSGAGYSESYYYDTVGRPSQTAYTADASYTIDYTYDSSTGLPDTVTYPVSTSSYRLPVRYCVGSPGTELEFAL